MKKMFLCSILVLLSCGPKNNTTDLTDLNKKIAYLETTLDLYITMLQDLENEIGTMQTTIESMVIDLAALKGYKDITKVIDPCGDGPGFDEVILALSDGTYLRYTGKNGSKGGLVLIGVGYYVTRDKQKCNFAIDSNGLTW